MNYSNLPPGCSNHDIEEQAGAFDVLPECARCNSEYDPDHSTAEQPERFCSTNCEAAFWWDVEKESNGNSNL